MICSFVAILAWKSDDDDDADVDNDDDADADNDYDDDRKSDPYMSPSYAGDTKSVMSLYGAWELEELWWRASLAKTGSVHRQRIISVELLKSNDSLRQF